MTPYAVLLASLAGSLHCAAMCGAFAATCGARGGPGAQLGYHAGRLAVYVALGAGLGFLGGRMDGLVESLVGVQRVAGVFLGLMLLWMGVRALRPRGLVALEGPPGRLARLRRRLARGPFAVGALSGLLPCGWLWGFVVLAGATGASLDGAAVMGAFWLGTVPALAGVGLLSGRLGRPLGRYAPRLTAVLLLAAGLVTLGARLPALLSPEPAGDCCHGGAS